MNENTKKFIESLQNSKDLETKFIDARGDVEKIVNLAKESGYDISPDDLKFIRVPISENLYKFLDAAQKDKILQAKLADSQGDTNKIIAVAKDAGYDISVNDLKMFETSTKGEISDDELDNVVGGYVLFMQPLVVTGGWKAAIIEDTTGEVLCICSSNDPWSTYWQEIAQKRGQSAEVILPSDYKRIFGKFFPY